MRMTKGASKQNAGGTGRGGVSLPFRAPWKKNLTINTCRHDIVTIMRDSIMEKLNIRDSVERTVLRLRFSRVRKYFWLREMVESWPESLKRDSSKEERCSGEVPCFEGSSARASFSTYSLSWAAKPTNDLECGVPYSNLKVDHLFGESRHIIRETKTVVADIVHRKNKVSLPFFCSFKDDFFVRAGHLVVNIKRTARLDLSRSQSEFTEAVIALNHGSLQQSRRPLLSTSCQHKWRSIDAR